MKQLEARELEAAKQHPNSIARRQVTDAAIVAMIELVLSSQGVGIDGQSQETVRARILSRLAILELALEVLRG